MERNLLNHFHHRWVCWQKYGQNSIGMWMWPITVELQYALAYSFVLAEGVPVNTYWFDLELLPIVTLTGQLYQMCFLEW